MWAMMPMFLVLLRGDCLGTGLSSKFSVLSSKFSVRSSSFVLPAIVGKRLVRLGHPMRVFALLHRAAAQVRGVEEFVRELFVHRLAVAARARVADQPADAEREAAVRIHLHRHLVVRAADAARFHLEAWLDVVDRLLEHLQRIVAALFLDDVEGLVNDALGGAALTVAHHAVDELAHERTPIKRVRRNVALWNLSSSRHLWFLNQLAPSPDSGESPTLSSVASRRTSIGPASAPARRRRRACRARRDSERPAGPSRGRRESAPASVPGGCAPHRGCTSSPRCRWSAARARPCAAQNSASWASG